MEYCPHCFSALPPDAKACPACGAAAEAPVNPRFLQPGTVLAGRYRVGAEIGAGGFGVTYVCFDMKLNIRVAVKEYFPATWAGRDSAGSSAVVPSGTQEESALYDRYKTKFLEEVRTLARFSHLSGIVSVIDVFEENNTAYMVMEFLEGQTLKSHIRQRGRIPAGEAVELLRPVMDALIKIHESGVVHRDISPDNIILTEEGAKLIDFGAARIVSPDRNSGLTIVLKRGYAPIEQYLSNSEQGPWTDVYALSATLYECVTGRRPPESIDRMKADDIKTPGALGVQLPAQMENAIMKGLSLYDNNRFRTVGALRDALDSRAPAQSPPQDATAAITLPTKGGGLPPAGPAWEYTQTTQTLEPQPVPYPSAQLRNAPQETKKDKPGKAAIVGIVSAAAVIVIAVIAVVLITQKNGKPPVENNSPAAGSQTEAAQSVTDAEQPAAAAMASKTETLLSEIEPGDDLSDGANAGISEKISDIKVGLILLHDESAAFDRLFIDAMRKTAESLNLDEEQFIIKSNVPESPECYESAVELADYGCDIVIANSIGHEDFMISAAREFPNVQFCTVMGVKAHTEDISNYHNVYAAVYEGSFLSGIAAGMKLNEMISEGKISAGNAKLGYVASFPYAEAISDYTAFFLGARSVCPDATMEVRYSASWNDGNSDREAAAALINSGCRLLGYHTYSEGVPEICEEKNILHVSFNGSTMDRCPKTYVVSSRINWQPFFEFAIRSVANGQTIPPDWTGSIATGSIDTTEINPKTAAKGTEDKIIRTKADLMNGKIRVFDTSTFTVNGTKLTEYSADIDSDPMFEPDTNVVSEGYFHESEYRSAPYFDAIIDGITVAS